MCWRCACVSVTLLAFADETSALPLWDEQPATPASSASTAIPNARERKSFFIVIPTQIRTVPPAAAQRLEQRSRVGVAFGLSLHQRDARLLVVRFRGEQRKIAGVTVARLLLREVERGPGGVFRGSGGVERIGILLQGRERVGDVLEGSQHRALVLLRGFRVRGLGRAFLVLQGSALENRRGEVGSQPPETRAGLEQPADRERGAARVGAQCDVGKAIGNGHAYLRAGGMQVCLRL